MVGNAHLMYIILNLDVFAQMGQKDEGSSILSATKFTELLDNKIFLVAPPNHDQD